MTEPFVPSFTRRSALLAALPFASACAGSRASSPGATVIPPAAAAVAWRTELDRDHPLVGKVWDVAQGDFVAPEELARRAASARFVLVGERHDNPDHHALQARLLQALVDAGRKPALVLEMLELQQQPLIDAYRARADASAARFGAELEWHHTSWPAYADYEPIFAVAFASGLSILAGNVAQTDAKALVKQGLSALPAERVAALRLGEAFPLALEQALLAELRDSHCGQLPERLLGPMALAQHARDSQMAAVLAKAGAGDGALLIAGTGHVRKDRGVPYYLSALATGATCVSVAVLEVEHAQLKAQDYVARHPHAAPPFDYLWFTPRSSDEDPCAAFKAK